MSRRKKMPKKTELYAHDFAGRCAVHDKANFVTKRAAKMFLKGRNYQSDRKTIFVCDYSPFFHVGGLPDAAKHGEIGREDVYSREYWDGNW